MVGEESAMVGIEIISMGLTAVATCVIAFYSWRSFKLSEEIKRSNELKTTSDQEFRQQVSDLYQAIVISTLISGPSSYGAFGPAKDVFKSQYRGKTPIFKE